MLAYEFEEYSCINATEENILETDFNRTKSKQTGFIQVPDKILTSAPLLFTKCSLAMDDLITISARWKIHKG
jgi:hypothetical protein